MKQIELWVDNLEDYSDNASIDAENGTEEDVESTETLDKEIEVDVSVEDSEAAERIPGRFEGKNIEGTHLDEISNSYKRFVIHGFDASTNPAAEPNDNLVATTILMQNGPVRDNGFNGITIEDLLIVSREILEGYQSGKFKCDENQIALDNVNNALRAIRNRLERRAEEGTLDTLKV